MVFISWRRRQWTSRTSFHPTYQCISIPHTTTSHDITVISKFIIKLSFFLYYTAMRKFDTWKRVHCVRNASTKSSCCSSGPDRVRLIWTMYLILVALSSFLFAKRVPSSVHWDNSHNSPGLIQKCTRNNETKKMNLQEGGPEDMRAKSTLECWSIHTRDLKAVDLRKIYRIPTKEWHAVVGTY